MIDTIIFDFDGVLVESVDIKTQAFAHLFEKYGSEVVKKVVAHHLANGGLSRFEKIKHYYRDILNEPLTETKLQELCEQFSELVMEEIVNAPSVPGAKAFLDEKCSHYRFFVISGTPQEELRAIVSRRNIASYFEAVYGTPPDKTALTAKALKMNNISPEKTVFVGDSMTDYEAAQANFIKFVGRLLPGKANPFPTTAITIPDLTYLEDSIHRIHHAGFFKKE